MFTKLEQVEQKFEDLTQRMASGTLAPRDLTAMAKEQARLRETVTTYREYKKNTQELAESKSLLEKEKDDDMRVMAREEVTELEKRQSEFEKKLKLLLIPTDPNDEKNIILEIRAGTGGEEAGLFVADLFRMYTRFADSQGWKIDIVSSNETDKGGFKEIIAMVTGDRVYSKLKYESGIHRVQRVPDTEASGRIHTSAVSVAILPEAEDIELDIPPTDLRIDVMRAGGAGGQHVNKTESAVRITHLPTNLVVVCMDDRSQHKNKAQAMKILRSRLLDKMQQEQHAEEAQKRKTMVGSGDRSEKIRTYNFPQSRVTDHRIGLTVHALDAVLNGDLNRLCDPLQAYYQAEAMKGGV
ncbi:MAG TPA: peptide chain release factor 1 [bacterium]|nr:peptide chain release factor 1 [bacterium]